MLITLLIRHQQLLTSHQRILIDELRGHSNLVRKLVKVPLGVHRVGVMSATLIE